MDLDRYQVRPATEAEYPDFIRCFRTAIGEDPDKRAMALFRAVIDLDRTLVAVDGRDGVVATAVSVERELTVPGAVLPAAHVTEVSVQATHRRQGLLRHLMTRLVSERRAAAREPVAVLWASEDAIYGRFGYGQATRTLAYDADVRQLSIVPAAPAGGLRMVDTASALPELAAVYDAVRTGRPGNSARTEALWRLHTADHGRDGLTKLRSVLHERDGVADGYAMWRVRSVWESAGPVHVVEVAELLAADLGGYLDLWRFLFSIDLSRRIRYRFAPLDDPLPHLVDAPSRLDPKLATGMWLRILDLPAALAARRYLVPVDAVLEVTDGLLPGNAGRFRLRGDQDGASCVPADGPADVALDIRELAAAYLGGTPLTTLADAGLVRELRPGALAPLSAAFGARRAPTSTEIF